MRIGLIAMAALCVVAVSPRVIACEAPASVCSNSKAGSFPLIRSGQPASVFVDAVADSAVKLVAKSFAADLERVSGKPARRVTDPHTASGNLVIIGALGQSAVIDELVRARKLKADDISGQWEASRQMLPSSAYQFLRSLSGGNSHHPLADEKRILNIVLTIASQ